jgi:hypothetical protein
VGEPMNARRTLRTDRHRAVTRCRAQLRFVWERILTNSEHSPTVGVRFEALRAVRRRVTRRCRSSWSRRRRRSTRCRRCR